MRIGVIGTGYVGLVAGAGFADFGNDVVCIDIDEQRIARLLRGDVPIHEPGLPAMVAENAAAGRLRFSTKFADATEDADVILLCVGTPPAADGRADLSQVFAAAEAVGKHLSSEFTVIVDKSTVPVGTAERVRDIIAGVSQRPFAVVSNPEFLKEGSALDDFLRPDRVIVGVGPSAGPAGRSPALSTAEQVDERARVVIRQLYSAVVRKNDRLLFMDARSAELTKYASNAYLAMRISFMNDVARLCEHIGADVELVRRGMGMDQRIGPSFLFPGVGYGGSCFPKDTRALIHIAEDVGLPLPLVSATESINARQKRRLFDKLLAHFGKREDEPLALTGKRIAVWGLSFKPETDDVREAPALTLIEKLVALGAEVRAYDPVASETARQSLSATLKEKMSQVEIVASAHDALPDADALCLCTEWRQLRQPDFRKIVRLLRGKLLLDGRNIWDPAQVRAAGLVYQGIGRR
ncbi:MAG: UDP-glucose/GDP-mannose dehydrogenase family protein [Polyangia bacterium]